VRWDRDPWLPDADYMTVPQADACANRQVGYAFSYDAPIAIMDHHRYQEGLWWLSFQRSVYGRTTRYRVEALPS